MNVSLLRASVTVVDNIQCGVSVILVRSIVREVENGRLYLSSLIIHSVL